MTYTELLSLNVSPTQPPNGRPKLNNFDDIMDDYLDLDYSKNIDFYEFINVERKSIMNEHGEP